MQLSYEMWSATAPKRRARSDSDYRELENLVSSDSEFAERGVGSFWLPVGKKTRTDFAIPVPRSRKKDYMAIHDICKSGQLN